MRPLSGALLLTALLGCASSPRPAPASDDAATGGLAHVPRPRRNANVITRDELADPTLSGSSGLDAVRRLRPTFLTRRGATSLRDPEAGVVKVSIDGHSLSPLSDLEQIRTSEIRSIIYLSASDATQRFGVASNGSPVILVERM